MLQLLNKIPRNLIKYKINRSNQILLLLQSKRNLSDFNQQDEESKLGGFAKAFDKYTAPAKEEAPVEDRQSFASLLRNSKFIDLGDPEGKIVTGKIFHTVDDDLYIDFGWKFHCVCTRPARNASDYVRGAKVKLRIKDLELSTRFIGSSKDLTILESDCHIIGLLYSPTKHQQPSSSGSATSNSNKSLI